jgi:hypothetical protein
MELVMDQVSHVGPVVNKACRVELSGHRKVDMLESFGRLYL